MTEIPLTVTATLLVASVAALLAYRSASRRERALGLLRDQPEAKPVSLNAFRGFLRDSIRGRSAPRFRFILYAALGITAFALTGNPVMAILPWPGSCVLRRFLKGRERRKYRDALESQVLELIDSLGQSLRSGLSLQQSLEICVEDVGSELREIILGILQDIGLGSGLEQALAEAASSSPIPSLKLVLTVLGLLHGRGGDLPRILERLRKRVVEGLEARREIGVLTSQSRASGYLVSGLPLFFILLQAALNPQSLRPLFTTSLGNLIIAAATGLNAAAFLIIRRIVSTEV